MDLETDLTTRIVVSAIVAGVISYKMYRPGMNKEQQDQFATQFFIIALGIFIFFKPAAVIIGIGAALLGFLHFAPLLVKQTTITATNLNEQYREFKGLVDHRPDPVGYLEGHVPEDVLEEQREYLRSRGDE